MKVRHWLPLPLISLLISLLFTGCATHRVVDRAAVDAELRMGAPGGGAGAYVGSPLPFPLRLAVVFSEPEEARQDTNTVTNTVTNANTTPGHALRWSADERDARRLEPLLKENLVSGVVVLTEVPAGAPLDDLRAAARAQGADAVLVLSAAGDTVRNTNKWAWAYLTIVGGWVVPGTRVDCLAVVRGTLWGMDGDAPYTTITAEGEAYRMAPAFLLDSDRPMREARGVALEQFYQELVNAMRKVATLHGAPALRASST